MWAKLSYMPVFCSRLYQKNSHCVQECNTEHCEYLSPTPMYWEAPKDVVENISTSSCQRARIEAINFENKLYIYFKKASISLYRHFGRNDIVRTTRSNKHSPQQSSCAGSLQVHRHSFHAFKHFCVCFWDVIIMGGWRSSHILCNCRTNAFLGDKKLLLIWSVLIHSFYFLHPSYYLSAPTPRNHSRRSSTEQTDEGCRRTHNRDAVNTDMNTHQLA